MVHNPWTVVQGNAEEMRKQADDLDIIAQASVEAYKANSCLLDDEIHELMDKETWILPEKALEYGFATEVRKKPEDGLQQSAVRKIIEKLTTEPEPVIYEGETNEEIMAKLDAIDKRFDELLKARINQAKRLLVDTQLPVSAIIESCGYGSSTYFRDAFRKETGVTPLVWRKENKG